MIETKRYSTLMSRTLKEGVVGKSELKKKYLLKGTRLQMYSLQEGRLFYDVLDANFPVTILYQKEEPYGKGLETIGIWMSDAPLEQESTLPAVPLAKGEVLICGLGIGLLPTLIKDKEEVTHIDIVEINSDIIRLIFNQIKTPKMTIIQADAWRYLAETDKKYDFIHIDIWGSITAPLQEIEKATELGKQCLKPTGKIRCWLQELYERIVDKLPKKPTYKTGEAGTYPPCLICGKTFRNDFAGLCMDCADCMGLSEIFMPKEA
jgi:hypothetical protein